MKYHYDNKWNDEPQIHGCWFIDTDGVTVLQWTCTNGASGDILLSDGRVLKEQQHTGRAFGSHPDQNPNIGKDSDGVYFWVHNNESFKQELDEDGIPLPGPLPFPDDWPPQGGE